MDPRAVLHPVGPHPPGVYWRRRVAVVAAFAVVIAVVIAAAASGGGGGTGAARPSRSPEHSASPPASPAPPSSAPAARVRCDRRTLAVAASTDATSYPAPAEPRLAVTVRDAGPRPCRFDAAANARTWTILSGSDRIWSTGDCPRGPARQPLRLRPGHPIVYTIVWDRRRSIKGCASPGTAAKPGTYRLYVTVDGVTSAAAVFRLS